MQGSNDSDKVGAHTYGPLSLKIASFVIWVLQELPLNLADFMVLKEQRSAASKGINQLRKGNGRTISMVG